MSRTKKWLAYLFVIAWALILLGIASVRWGFMPLQAGLMMAAAGAVIALVYGLLTLPVVLFKSLLRKSMSASAPTYCVFGLLPAVVMVVSVGFQGLSAPAIHDITTDTDNPPRFILAKDDRQSGDNDTEYEGDVIARLQHQAYGDIQPVMLSTTPDAAFDTVLKTVDEMGWRKLGTRTSDGNEIVEAVARSAIFGFEDDVVVRVSRSGKGARVDIRSASRVGLGDLGANAARVKAFKTALLEKY